MIRLTEADQTPSSVGKARRYVSTVPQPSFWKAIVMPRSIDVAKVIHAAGESKFINLDLTVREVVGSSLIGSVAGLDEPWDLICADWISVIRRGPRFDSVLEIAELAGTLRKSLGALEKATAGLQR